MNTLLSESLADVRRHAVPVCCYAAASLAVAAVYRGVVYLPDGLAWEPLARLAFALYLACASSLVQAVCFAALGAAIARPMWKWRGPRDGLVRFFMPWLIINLFLVMLADIHRHFFLLEQEDLASLLELALMVVHVAALPLGTAIMYWGALSWPDLPATLAPLTRFFRLTLQSLGVGLFQYVLLGVRASFLEPDRVWTLALYAVTDIPILMLDVIIFAQVWRICMLNSTTPPNADDSPFDF